MGAELTKQDLLTLGAEAHEQVESETSALLDQADLAEAYVTVAADLLDRGEYTHALQLCRRAGDICPAYAAVHAALGGES